MCATHRSQIISSSLSISEIADSFLTSIAYLSIGAFQAQGVVGNNLAEYFVEVNGDAPVGIVRLKFCKVRNVADVIALTVFLNILPVQFPPCHLLYFAYGFKHRNAVFAAATEIVDLATTWVGGKLLNSTDHVAAVDVIAAVDAGVLQSLNQRIKQRNAK